MGSFSGLEPENYVENKQFYVLKVMSTKYVRASFMDA